MGAGKNWTPEDIAYLEDNWGSKSMKTIMLHLNRSEDAIKVMKVKLGLGAFLDSGEYITFNQLRLALGRGGGSGYLTTSWVKNRDFPLKYKRVNECRFMVVYLDDFWKWAEQNRTFIDFSKVEENILGKEPAWVKEQRRLDWEKRNKYRTCPWTAAEDQELKFLLKQKKYTYDELSKRLHRTCGAIQRRCCDLNLIDRPVKADNMIKWTDDELQLLDKLIKQGMSYDLMSDQIHKSSKALRGKVYVLYGTENLDKIIQGNINPVKHEQQKQERNQRRAEQKAKAELTRKLISLLLIKRNSMEFGEFWQKDLCYNWHELKGCLANEHDCDSCASFIRIRPQYCVRCGDTIISRDKENICQRCKDQRKKQAQRKYAIKNKYQEVR